MLLIAINEMLSNNIEKILININILQRLIHMEILWSVLTALDF